ncbi:hypothetical protein L6164_037591 [Bauhinia variegata]|uniref:Uncharacterized protein n=1 Tax=Bauhinia variegata TaxID=167791 RepID=A0ACB9KKN3_BAUVA|nr:hypothetical protein L6164_037591 [Bauhinia variegata]
MDYSQNGNVKSTENGLCTVPEVEGDLSKLLDKPRTLNLSIDRQRSCDERSLSELSLAFSPRPMSKNAENTSRPIDHPDNAFSPGPKSVGNTPGSLTWDPNPIVSEAWEALRRSLVYFRGQPVGTIAASDNSDEKLNYDQVPDPCSV